MITDVLDRIEQRLVAVGLSATAASKQAGLNPDAIRNIRRAAASESGERSGPQRRTLAALAKVLQTSPEWLLTGKDEQAEQVAGGAAGAPSLPYLEWYEAPAYLDPDRHLDATVRLGDHTWPRGSFVTRAPDDSMNRLAPAGAYIVVDRTERLVSTGLIYLGVLDGQLILRRWLPNPERAEPFSTDPAYQTEFLRPGRRWEIIGRVRRIFLDV
ncbi:MAG TPA: S24 family peptidase [Caulobacteraceae bacterium]|jgi:SOS-response transcriptional repressor LexA|nr:S24 family peptidase [Caulobacteraceae bacterium]